MKREIAIIGAGVGGLEMAGHLGLNGHRVRVHDIRDNAVSSIRDKGGIEVDGIATGFAPIERATTDLAAAIKGAELIMVATLHNDYETVASGLAQLVSDGQAICLIPGYVGGALAFRHTLRTLGCRVNVPVAEMDSFPFTGRIVSPAVLHLASVKQRLHVAALPATSLEEVVQLLRAAFPQAVAAPSVLHTGLMSMNPMLHVPGMLANAARIESGDKFDFYRDGISPNVANLVLSLDAERVAVAAAFGVRVQTQLDWLGSIYGLKEGDLYTRIQKLHRDIFKDSPAPTTLNYRYLTEDVPFGLVPMIDLARSAMVRTPVAEALTQMASALLDRNFWAEGRTLKHMGLAGLSADAIRARLILTDG